MKLTPTAIPGVIAVAAEPHRDERGFFARLAGPVEFEAAGLDFMPRQTSLSRNVRRHTLRGMHYCHEPETKLVRCVRGRIYDVALDLRPQSPAFRKWIAAELDAGEANGLILPPGVAHGFLTLVDDCDVMYQIDRIWRPGYDAGVRWDDPAFAIAWPAAPAAINSRDATYPDFEKMD